MNGQTESILPQNAAETSHKKKAPCRWRPGAFWNCCSSSSEEQKPLAPKLRLMSFLLDKIGTSKPAISADNAIKNAGGEITSIDSASQNGKPNFQHEVLDDTQPSANLHPMTFTYAPGTNPLPQYTIRRGIGVGGFGEVYFAVSDAGKEVAIKRIQRNLEVELRGASQCLNLKHPNLVSLYDICKDESEQSWVVMEYIAGSNLRDVLDKNPDGLPASEVNRWFKGIALGVAHLHSSGLVHRDLKPGNVFDDLGIVKVGDYGLSKFISASHRGGHTESVGTFHYMAPEIGRGQYGREIDIYALGILLYELLTGAVPFDGESCHEIIVKHLTATPDLSQIAQPYRNVISRALEKDPAKRTQTVAEMLEALDMAGTDTLAAVEIPNQANLVEPVARFENESQNPPPLPLAQNASAVQSPSAKMTAQSNDEPLARAIRTSLSDFNDWWSKFDKSPRAKMFMVIAAAFIVIVNTSWLLPLLSIITIFYVPYYVIRQMVLHVRMQPTYAEAQRIASAAGYKPRPMTRREWRDYMRNELRAKHSIHRMAELSTSWTAATMTVLAMGLGAGVIGLHSGPVDAVAVSPYGWMLLVVLLGSLGILGMGKLWERDEGEGLPRRLVLAGLGAGVGFAAFQIGEYLMLPVNVAIERDVNASPLPQALYTGGNTPTVVAYMAHFALLFSLVRWWKPVDPLRRTRLSLWNVATISVAAWLIHQFVPIMQPSGMLIAGGIAVAVQMSAPWIDQRSASQQDSSRGTPPKYPREQLQRESSPQSPRRTLV